MFEGTSDEKLTQALIILQSLHRDLEGLRSDVKDLKDDGFHPLDTRAALLEQRQTKTENDIVKMESKMSKVAVDEERINRLEKVVYGAVALVITNLIGLLTYIIIKH